jgi:hypothetical protein
MTDGTSSYINGSNNLLKTDIVVRFDKQYTLDPRSIALSE